MPFLQRQEFNESLVEKVMNKRISKKTIKLLIGIFVTIILCGVAFIYIFTLYVASPRSTREVGTATSNDSKYQITVEIKDFGGSFSDCEKQQPPKGCGGNHVFAYIQKYPLFLSRKEYIQKPNELPCGPESGCYEELERFDFDGEHIYWYGKRLNVYIDK